MCLRWVDSVFGSEKGQIKKAYMARRARRKTDQYGDAEHLDIGREGAHFPRFEYRAENCDDVAGRFPDKIERADILMQAEM